MNMGIPVADFFSSSKFLTSNKSASPMNHLGGSEVSTYYDDI
jgi:hypothetical protein